MAKKPPTEEVSVFGLLTKDLTTDREILRTFAANLTALKTWLPGISSLKTRETFRLFIEDSRGCLLAMAKQRELMLGTLAKLEDQWQQQQRASAPNAMAPKSTSSIETDSSAPGATEQDSTPGGSSLSTPSIPR